MLKICHTQGRESKSLSGVEALGRDSSATATGTQRIMKDPGEHSSYSVPCPNCQTPTEHGLAWLKGRSQFEFYRHPCGHRDDLEIARIVGLHEALRADFTEPERM